MTRRQKDAWWSRNVLDLASLGSRHCERCLLVATDAHHVYGKKAHPELRHLLCNGVALCRKDHNWAHANPVEFRAWFAMKFKSRMSDLLQYRRDFRDGVLPR
jgi:hypothetical protein